MSTGISVPPPRAAAERSRRRGAATAWWAGILLLSAADAAGFYTNLELLLKNGGNIVMVGVLLVACAACAILLPWRFGVTLSQRRRGVHHGWLVLALQAVLWLGLGAAMFYIRTTMNDLGVRTAGPLFGGADIDAGAGQEAVLIAGILLLLYCVTALMASTHAFHLTETRLLTDLRREREQLRRRLDAEREARDQEEDLLSLAKEQGPLRERATALEVQATQALALLEASERIERIARSLGDPESTTVLIDEYDRKRNASGQI